MIKSEKFLVNPRIFRSKNLISQPKISIILPTYCRGDNGMLKASIENVLNQSFNNFELIIVDDGSVDNTFNIGMHFIEKDNRIVYIRNELNSGLPALRVNQGLLHSRGDFICYQFDDDLWRSTALEDLYNFIKDRSICLAYGCCSLTYENDTLKLGRSFDSSVINESNFIANNAVIHHREVPFIYGGYDCHIVMRRLCDWDLWIRWSKYIPFYFLDKIVSFVKCNNEKSLGETCIYDPDLCEKIVPVDRHEKLKLERINDYIIDSLDLFDEIGEDKQVVYTKHIEPWRNERKKIL